VNSATALVILVIFAAAGITSYVYFADSSEVEADREAHAAADELAALLLKYFMETGSDAADMKELENASFCAPGHFAREYYAGYEWSGAIVNGRYVGDITAFARDPATTKPFTKTYGYEISARKCTGP